MTDAALRKAGRWRYRRRRVLIFAMSESEMLGTYGMSQSLKFSKFWSNSKKRFPAAENVARVLFCTITSIMSVKRTKIQYLQSCVCAENFIYEKSTKTVATRAAPFRTDMHQIVCRLGLRPDPTGGAYSAPSEPLPGLEVGPRGRDRKRREEQGRGADERGWTPPDFQMN